MTAANTAVWMRRALRAKCATTANMSSISGTSNVDGQTIAAGDLVLVWKQSTASQNGLYVVQSSGNWTKVVSFAAGDVGAQVGVSAGTSYGRLNFIVSAANTLVAGGAVYL